MGVSNFQKWIKNKYPNCIVPVHGNRVYDYIYIDVNYILHTATSGYTGKKKIDQKKMVMYYMNRVTVYLDMILKNFSASKKIVLVVDGPSSYAKILLQRDRRLDMVKKKDFNLNKISAIHLTPGTTTMSDIEKYLWDYVKILKNRYKYLHVDVKFSPSTEPDEGELKIFNKVKKYGTQNIRSTHLVVGTDADIILLGMAIKPVYNTYVYVKIGRNEPYIISIKKLIKEYAKDLYMNTTLDENILYNMMRLQNRNMRDDFVFITFMQGNDYIPKLKNTKADSLDILMNTYKLTINTYRRYITTSDGSLINTDILSKFMLNLLNTLPKRFQKMNAATYSDELVKKYIEGLLWCLNMYRTASCSKYDYIYDDTTPSPADILYYLELHPDVEFSIPRSENIPLSNTMHATLVLPKKARSVVPKKYVKYVDKHMSNIYKKEMCKVCEKFDKVSIKLNLQKKLTNKDNKDAIKSMNSKIKNSKNKYILHKKTHVGDFTIKDILKVSKLKV